MTQTQIVEAARKMSAKEIIMTMVNGLKNPATEIRMLTFGFKIDEICFGCAATNFICKINNGSTELVGQSCDDEDFALLEDAINKLREGRIENYNKIAGRIGIAQIDYPDFNLPVLKDENYLDNLDSYIKLAEIQ